MIKYVIIGFFAIQLSYAQVSDFDDIDFTRADNIAKLNEGESLKNLPLLAFNLTSKLHTQAEKFRAIYTWVCLNVRGDIRQNIKIEKKRKRFKSDSLEYIKWNEEYKKTAFKKLLKHKKTMCTGYAYLLKELCFLSNIDCKIINGYGITVEANVEKLELVNHSWNAVKLNNKWYLCDATWSSGYSNGENVFIKEFNDGYFLTEPVLFAKSHYPIEKKWLLDSALLKSAFVPSPVVYSDTYKYKIIPIAPTKLNVEVLKNTEINFTLKTLKAIKKETISLIQFLGNKEERLKIYDFKYIDGFIQFKHTFTRKGLHDIHIKVNDDIVLTYVVEVS